MPTLEAQVQQQPREHVNSSRHQSSWLNVLSHLDPKYGGLSSAVPALSSAVAQNGISVELTAFCKEDEHYTPSVARGVDVSFAPIARTNWFNGHDLKREFREKIARVSGIHIHGLWEYSTAVTARLARAEDKPYVISAHGMLEAWALANKRWKKVVYAAMVERTNLKRAACLHALTRSEVDDYRRFGLNNPVAVIPNGVTIPDGCSPEVFLDRFPNLRGKRLILFLGRIHFKKGLDLLSQAWTKISAKWPEAHLVFAGPDSEGTQAQVEAQLESLGVRQQATFTGMLTGPLKWSAFAAAECFVLPSRSEGLSVSVLEAMGMGVPVVITAQCNLPDVATYECGWVIQPNADELELALHALLKAGTAERNAMGNRGQKLVARQYDWRVIGAQMAAVYCWAAGGPLPTNVDIDHRSDSL